jgi:predicted MFS family arabinose efflux permease
VWFLFALSTSFVFWVALMKALRLMGNSSNQGTTYGWYYALNSLVSIAANAVYLKLYMMKDDASDKIFIVIVGMSVVCLIAAVFILLYQEPKIAAAAVEEEDKFRLRDLPEALRNVNLWAVAIIMFMLYAAYSCSSYFTPYFTAHIGIEPNESAVIGFIRGYVLLMLAPVGGFIADRLLKSTLKFYVIGFIGLFILFLSVLIIPASKDGLTMAIVISFITSIFLFLMYGIMWSLISEVKIPVRYGATAIGVASLAAYMPDLFLYTIFGNILDNKGDVVGYNVIFITLAAFCIVALVLCIWLFGRVKRLRLKDAEQEPVATLDEVN